MLLFANPFINYLPKDDHTQSIDISPFKVHILCQYENSNCTNAREGAKAKAAI